jgi:hypothetical protein
MESDDPKQLRANYEELAKAVRSLERRSEFSQDGTALRALREARDKAESAWRAAKAPAPLPTRMAWAEAKLERAAAALTKARYAIEELDAEYDRRREALCRKADEADAWHKWRQQQVDDLHSEAAEKAPNRKKGQATQGGTEVRDKIRCQLLPELQSIMEHVEGNPEILEKLSLLAAGLVDAESRLEDRHGGDATETYDMADGDSEKGTWGAAAGDTVGKGAAGSGQGKAKAEHAGGKGRPTEWRAEGPGRWTRAAAANGAGDTSAEVARQATAAGAAAHNERGPGEGVRGNEGGCTAGGTTGTEGQNVASGAGASPAGSDDEREKPPKHRRRRSDADERDEAREASDRRRAEELHAQQAAAAAAQIESFNAGTGGFGSEAALSLAAQKYVVEVQNVQRRAARQGVNPKTDDGRTLLELSPMELQRWAETNLGEEEEY